ATRRPQVRRPSLPRPESPQRQAPTPSKLSLSGLRTPSGTTRPVPSPNGFPRSPIKPPSRMSERPPSRVSTDDDVSSVSVRTSDMHQRDSTSTEIQDLKDNVKILEKQLLERD